MSHRIICPICGTENPEGTEFCTVCAANLSTLPKDIYPPEPEEIKGPALEVPETGVNEGEELDMDSPIPGWLADRFNQKKEPRRNFDFNSYSDAIFGITPTKAHSSAPKSLEPVKRKKEPVFQPTLENMIDPPLVETDDDGSKSIPDDTPGLQDFSIQRPARKWDDTEQKKGAGKAPKKTRNTTANLVKQLPLWLQQDMPLIESDEDGDTSKNAAEDDPELLNSVSPTKVADAAEIFRSREEPQPSEVSQPEEAEAETAAIPAEPDEFTPESGTLLSDLMQEINSSSETPTPREQESSRSGTVFYSGNHPGEEPEPLQDSETDEIVNPTGDSGGSAMVLDQILRHIGYQVEGEPQPESEAESSAGISDIPLTETAETEDEGQESDVKTGLVSGTELPVISVPEEKADPLIDNALIELDDSEEKTASDKMAERYDDSDEQDIPWDLFSAADMTLPQSPEDPTYRTFSRSGIPEDSGSTGYQQRMLSSVLGRILHAENFVAPREKPNTRAISVWTHLFWSLLAIGGVLLILLSGITDRFQLPAASVTAETAAFYEYAESAAGDVLIVMDYSPAYNAELGSAADGLIRTLVGNADQVYMSVLNPAAMPNARQMMRQHEEKLLFSGWWPAGVVSIRSRLSGGSIPAQVWLITSESGSVRDWAEQLAVYNGAYQLHVLASGQLETLLDPYLRSGMVTSALSRGTDLQHYGENMHTPDRVQFAVWYLAALVPLAWLCGAGGKFFSTEPAYERKRSLAEDTEQTMTEKEALDDRRI